MEIQANFYAKIYSSEVITNKASHKVVFNNRDLHYCTSQLAVEELRKGFIAFTFKVMPKKMLFNHPESGALQKVSEV